MHNSSQSTGHESPDDATPPPLESPSAEPGDATEAPAPTAVHDSWDGVRELHPAVMASRLAAGESIVLVDVREQWEWDVARLPGALHIPLGQFASASSSLDREAEIVVYCHHGARSLAAANFLAGHGFTRLWNLSGGIDRYALEVDDAVTRY